MTSSEFTAMILKPDFSYFEQPSLRVYKTDEAGDESLHSLHKTNPTTCLMLWPEVFRSVSTKRRFLFLRLSHISALPIFVLYLFYFLINYPYPYPYDVRSAWHLLT